MSDVGRDARAVLLPVAGELTVEPWLRELLASGTRSVLLGETREEYVARTMSARRRSQESPESFLSFVAEAENFAEGPVLVAVDQEPWGIARLHDLVCAFPEKGSLPGLTDEEIAAAAAAVGAGARRLGVTMFLAPVLDVLDGANPWLEGRTLSGGGDEVGRIAAAYVSGVQSTGVVAVAKHFPGHPALTRDPALHDTVLRGSRFPDVVSGPFSRVIAAGVRAIMTGPVVVEAVDPNEPASTSAATISLLRGQLGFQGLIVSDDLDAPSTTRGRSAHETVFAALDAGADLLLLPGGPDVVEIAERIASRAERDKAFQRRLSEAAQRVRDLAGTRTPEHQP